MCSMYIYLNLSVCMCSYVLRFRWQTKAFINNDEDRWNSLQWPVKEQMCIFMTKRHVHIFTRYNMLPFSVISSSQPLWSTLCGSKAWCDAYGPEISFVFFVFCLCYARLSFVILCEPLFLSFWLLGHKHERLRSKNYWPWVFWTLHWTLWRIWSKYEPLCLQCVCHCCIQVRPQYHLSNPQENEWELPGNWAPTPLETTRHFLQSLENSERRSVHS